MAIEMPKRGSTPLERWCRGVATFVSYMRRERKRTCLAGAAIDISFLLTSFWRPVQINIPRS
jgi:hypothetical protein